MLPQKDSLETQTTAIDLDAVLAAVKNMDIHNQLALLQECLTPDLSLLKTL